ncbi:hypothetical protein H0H93_010739 [Arthromyces matolae]|nr:hypothetical protein H0H93_010739 [Arthromyces matolae]
MCQTVRNDEEGRLGLASTSQAPADVIKTAAVPIPSSADAKKFGLENFCNNCYVNSVVQALYFCTPFRDLMLQYPDSSLGSGAPQTPLVTPSTPAVPLVPVRRKPERKPSTAVPSEPLMPNVAPIPSSPPTLFSALRSLFLYISTHPQERGTVSPRAFVDKLKEVNRVFDTTTHQDAHEFLNYLLNKIVEEVESEPKSQETPEDLNNSITTLQSRSSSAGYPQQHDTLVHRLFEGVLTSETRCLTCETVSSRDEAFLDLSIDIEQNSSVTACLRQFSASEMLCHKNKFFCDSCCDLQEAEKRMKIKRLPNVLALHLKRFKYQEESQRYVKLAYRVAFPFELRLFNTVDEIDNADRLYYLFGIVVHIGNGPHHGHYVSIVKTLGRWLLFDDENVSPIPESDIPKYFGDPASSSGCAYVLYYQAADIDMGKLGLRPEQTEEFRNTATPDHPHTMHPPGLSPEDFGATSTSTPSESSPSIYPLPGSSFPSPHPIPTSDLSAPSLRASISTSTSSSHSHPQRSASQHAPLRSPPSAPPLMGSHSSPVPAVPPKSTVGGIFKGIRKSPSVTVRTNIKDSNVANASITTPTSALSPINGFEVDPGSPTTLRPPSPDTANRPTTAPSSTQPSLTSRALPPVPPRPGTSGNFEREKEKDHEREKEVGWTKWFGGGGGRVTEPILVVNGVGDEHLLGSRRSVEGESSGSKETDSNTSVHLNGSINGLGAKKEKEVKDNHREKEKEKGKGAWFPKRKSFRIGDKKTTKNGSTAENEDSPDASTWFRTSLQLSQRRGSESGDASSSAPPPMSAVRSSPGVYQHAPAPPTSKHRPHPVSTETPHAHLQPHVLVNGEISPTPSSASSFDSGKGTNPVTSTVPLVPSSPRYKANHDPYPNRHASRSHHQLSQNGNPPPKQALPPLPAQRMHSSISTPPTPPPTMALPATPTTPHSRPRIHNGDPSSRAVPLSPERKGAERKKSLGSLQAFRGKEKEKPIEKPLSRSATTGPDLGRERERPLPPPPVVVPMPSTELKTHRPYQSSQHVRTGSVLGGAEMDEPLEDAYAPALATFGNFNTSAASSGSAAGTIQGNTGFKRATRKLSFTAPMLGFGKHKEKTKEKDKTGAPSAYRS